MVDWPKLLRITFSLAQEHEMPNAEPTNSFLDKLNPLRRRNCWRSMAAGIRGIVSLEVLYSIEQIVRQKLGRPDAVLADYFDYMAGTSTGAVSPARSVWA